jgi:hypothetical protein
LGHGAKIPPKDVKKGFHIATKSLRKPGGAGQN